MMTGDVWRVPGLKPVDRLVLLALVDYGTRAFPKQETLAAKCGLSRCAVCRSVARLREQGLITTKGSGKALRYVVSTPKPAGAPRRSCSPKLQQVCSTATAAVANSYRDPNYPNELPHLPAAAPSGATGWGVSIETWERILVRDPRAYFEGTRNVVQRVLREHKLSEADAIGAWRLLLEAWARTGTNAYDILKQHLGQLEGSRDVGRVVLHRIRGVA
jgi:biotin operon repressor